MAETINLGLFAHVDAGKTTLTEQLLFAAGAVRSAGRVDDGTARTDYTELERARKISIRAAAAQFSYAGVDVNLIDTPGHMDFSSEVDRTLRVVDCAVLIVSAVEGIQARTELVWDALAARKTPVVIFVNKLDRAGADLDAVLAALSAFSGALLPFTSVRNAGGPDVEPLPVPEAALAEAAAFTSDEAMDRYLSGTLSGGALTAALRDATARRALIPVFAGCAGTGAGVRDLLDGIVRLMPRAGGDETGPLSALCYKAEHDRAAGRICHVRLFSGSLSNRDAVTVNGRPEKVAQIRRTTGARSVDVGTVRAGQIAALCGLGARAGDILGDERLVPPASHLTEPLLTVKVTVPPEQSTALSEAAAELGEEDPLLRAVWVREKSELTLSVTGDIQLEVLDGILRSRYGLAPAFGPPSVIYRETPAAAGFGYDAYTMPKPCWAILKFRIEPLPRGSGVRYRSVVENNKIFYRYQSQVEDTIPRALRQGPSGWQVTDLSLTLVDGSHHTIHTHPLDFAVATHLAVMNGLASVGTVMLEPRLRYRLTVPEETVGKVMGEIAVMRGSCELSAAPGGRCRLEGIVPVASSRSFPNFVARVTGGRGVLSAVFHDFADCPQELCTPTEYRGISPLDRAKYILWVRKAFTDADMQL